MRDEWDLMWEEANEARTTTDMDLLWTHARSPKGLVRENVLMNPSVTSDMIRHVFEHTSCGFPHRAHAARHRTTPADILTTLAKNEQWEIRMLVAWNPSTPFDLVRKLTRDRHHKVRDTAKRAIEQRGLLELLGED